MSGSTSTRGDSQRRAPWGKSICPPAIWRIAASVAEWQRRRDVVLEELAGLPAIPPHGGWSLLLDVSPFGLSGAEASRRLLERGKVAATPMVNWGGERAGSYVRFVFANEPVERLRGLGRRVRFVARRGPSPHDSIERPIRVRVQYQFRHDSFVGRYHSRVELRHLRSFLAVAEELHFGRAAARLHISQPPLSQQIRRLEDEIGARLFRRTNRRVQLTPAGRAFLAEARQAIASAERAVGAAQRAERGELGELVVGYVTSATYGPLPDVIRMFRKRLPEVELKLRNLRSVHQSQALIDRRIDVGLVRPHAYVVLKPDCRPSDALAAELRDFVRGRTAGYKVPAIVDFVAELPRTVTGKIQRFRLRAGP